MPDIRHQYGLDPRRDESRVPLRRVLGAGEDPFAWSLPVFRMRRIQVRLHLLVPLWIAAELLFSFASDRIGPLHVSMAVGSLVVISLLREWMRAHAARVMGADKDTAIAWPLGGLTPVSRPGLPHPIAAELGGIVFGVAVTPMLVAGLWATGADLQSLVFNPLSPRGTLSLLNSPWQVAAWWLFYANTLILLMNVLLPMYPFDAAGVLHAWMRQRLGAARANDAVLRCGLFAAIAMLVLAATGGETRLLAVSIFAAAATLHQFRKNEFLYAPARLAPEQPHTCPDEAPEPVGHVASTGLADARTEPEVTDEDVDRVLAKISRLGIASITSDERTLLERATRMRRGS